MSQVMWSCGHAVIFIISAVATTEARGAKIPATTNILVMCKYKLFICERTNVTSICAMRLLWSSGRGGGAGLCCCAGARMIDTVASPSSSSFVPSTRVSLVSSSLLSPLTSPHPQLLPISSYRNASLLLLLFQSMKLTDFRKYYWLLYLCIYNI